MTERNRQAKLNRALGRIEQHLGHYIRGGMTQVAGLPEGQTQASIEDFLNKDWQFILANVRPVTATEERNVYIAALRRELDAAEEYLADHLFEENQDCDVEHSHMRETATSNF